MKPFVVSSTRIHDARLLATYGMYEHDAGEDDLALDLLSTALAEGVVRPQAAIDLAQIRFAKATQKPLGAGGRISKEQVLSVVEPLVPVLEQASSAEPYWIMAKAWEASDAKPTPNDIGLLTRGVRLFPRFTNIAYRAALVSGRSGYLEAANAMIESGKRFVVVKADLAEFERLRSTFPSPRTADAR